MFIETASNGEATEGPLPTHADLMRGLPARWAQDLIDRGALTRNDVALVIPIRTLNRRIAEAQSLTAREGDALTRLLRLVTQAREAFDGAEAADIWLRSANPALGGGVPIEMASTDAGARQVEAVLVRFEAGVFG
ncbi:MAG: antitoxin Xre/MbcA/ParS toxin-binding domain-containing protein [Pseudomonadota bacterium]